MILLQSIDQHWREHLAALDYLRQGIHLRGYAQKNPKQEYKREAFELFCAAARRRQDGRDAHADDRAHPVARKRSREAAEAIEERAEHIGNVTYTHPNDDGSVSKRPRSTAARPMRRRRRSSRRRRGVPKVGRNDPCPCGSGKKYKQCHGKLHLTRPSGRSACSSASRRSPAQCASRSLHAIPRPVAASGARRPHRRRRMRGVRKANRSDLTVVADRRRRAVAGVFTQNRFCAAPVQLCREHLAAGGAASARSSINTGNANAGTGDDGLARARSTCAALARLLGCRAEQVLPFSTGVIMETAAASSASRRRCRRRSPTLTADDWARGRRGAS